MHDSINQIIRLSKNSRPGNFVNESFFTVQKNQMFRLFGELGEKNLALPFMNTTRCPFLKLSGLNRGYFLGSASRKDCTC